MAELDRLRSLYAFFGQPQTPEEAEAARMEMLRQRGARDLGFAMRYGGPAATQAQTQQMQRIADNPAYFLQGSDLRGPPVAYRNPQAPPPQQGSWLERALQNEAVRAMMQRQGR